MSVWRSARGLAALRSARRRLHSGGVPGRELLDGVLILLAGALMLTPRFVTDTVGVRTYATSRLRHRAGLRRFRDGWRARVGPRPRTA